MIQFIKEHIIHRFGIPQFITTDQGTIFTRDDMTYFDKDYGIQLIRSTPFYVQSSGHTKASGKVLINILEKMLEENPRYWHIILFETLWAYRTYKRDSTRVSPYSLTYGHDVVLPIEVVVPSLRVSRHNGLNHQEYNEAMMMELKTLDGKRLQALDHIMIHKNKVARAYNKRVKRNNFKEGELVWKLVLPIGAKDKELGKLSPNWEGPFKVHQVLPGNAYWLSSLEGEPYKRFLNGK